MEILCRDGNYSQLTDNGNKLQAMFKKHLDASGHDYQITGDPTLFDILFTETPAIDYRTTITANKDKSACFNKTLRENGVFKSPGKTYPSLALTDEDLALTDIAIAKAASSL